MVDRSYVLDLMKSKDTTIEDFNYDKLTCPPLVSFFTPYDINRLKEIATSLRYSAKPQAKYKEIDKVMNSRGFVKLVAGTNRICYRCVEDDTFVIKVAYDKVGMGDNPREFVNQNYLKPFCTKVFEVAGDGVIASFERVKPILSREEFLSIAKDVFILLDEFIMGEYVLDDCGSKFFMNYGLRKGFGPVILDFTYLYKLDGRKLYCNRPDRMSETGYCDGEIDSDPGFNNFVCKKCGAIYRAADLAMEIEENKVIVKNKGENKMKITLKGGTNNINTAAPTTKVEEVIEEAKTIPAKKEVKEEPKSENRIKISLNRSSANTIENASADAGSTYIKKNASEKKPVEKKENKKDTSKKEKIQPIHFTEPQLSKIASIDEAIETIKKSYAYIEEDKKEKAKVLLMELIRYLLKKMDLTDDDLFSIVDVLTANLNITLDSVVHDEDHSVSVTAAVVNKNTGALIYSEAATANIDTSVENDGEYYTESTDEYYVDETDISEYSAEEYTDYIDSYAGVKYFEASTIDLATIFTNMAHKNVIVINDPAADSLLTTPDKNIIAIDRLNNIDAAEATIVASSVLNDLTTTISTVPEDTEEEEVAGNMEAPLENVEVTVNGVPSAK